MTPIEIATRAIGALTHHSKDLNAVEQYEAATALEFQLGEILPGLKEGALAFSSTGDDNVVEDAVVGNEGNIEN